MEEYTHVRNPRNAMVRHPLLDNVKVPSPHTPLTNKKAVHGGASCNVTSLFDQAYKFSSDHSWYKLQSAETVYVLLQPFDDGSGWKLAICCLEENEDDGSTGMEMRQRAFALNADHYSTGDVPHSMIEHSMKYPVTISNDLEGDGYTFPNVTTARYLFDRYMWYMKENGLVPLESNELPPFNTDTMSNIPHSFVPTFGGHRKWRMLGQIVNAACAVASDCGITVNSDSPYPPDSPVYDYMRK
jgi:hypothetical protein